MFESIIFYISALILSVSYPLKSGAEFSLPILLSLFISFGVFYVAAFFLFERLRIKKNKYENHALNSRILSILALIFFIVDLYFLHIPDLFSSACFVKYFPSLIQFLMVVLFSIYFIISLHVEWRYLSRRDYIDFSFHDYLNLKSGLAVPSIIPWFAASFIFDLISLVSSESFLKLIDSWAGQALYILLFFSVLATMVPFVFRKIWRCENLHDVETLEILDELSGDTGIGYRKSFLWPFPGGGMITAGVMGIFGRFRYILVTKGFVSILEKGEKKAVLAHEFGHIKHHHMLWYILLFSGFILTSYFFMDKVILYSILNFPFFAEKLMMEKDMFELLYSLATLASFILYFRYIFSFFMRNFEREADLFSFRITGGHSHLVSTFQKIDSISSEPADKPNWHHFSIAERVRFLISCHFYPENIRRHSIRLKTFLCLYFTAVAVFIYIGHSIGDSLDRDALVNHILYSVNKNRGSIAEDSVFYEKLGDLFASRKKEKDAIYFYSKAVELDQTRAYSLNNMAWIYITSENKDLADLEKGLKLAKKAYSIEKSPEITDTLAEAMFRTGKREEACALEGEALSKTGSNRDYYEGRIKEFCD